MQQRIGVRRMQRREPDEKALYKIRAKAFIESISRKCFGYSFKGLTLQKSARRGELKFVFVAYKTSFDSLKRFQDELKHRLTEFKVSYTGTINSKTNKEEWRVELIVFGELITRIENEPDTAKTHPVTRTKRDDREQPEIFSFKSFSR